MRLSTIPFVRGTIVAAAAIAACLTVTAATPGVPMPAAQQNALVQQFCAVCHTDAQRNGGLSLEHFDASHADPGEAAMIASKLKANAMGAAGLALPDKSTQAALLSALTAESAGAGHWTVSRTLDPTAKAPLLTASVVRSAPSSASAGEPDLFRLTLTCRPDTHDAEMQVAWSPGVPEQGRVISAAVDGQPGIEYKVEGQEKMGNGAAVTSGPGALILYSNKAGSAGPKGGLRLPKDKLTVSHLFGDEAVVFPFGDLKRSERQALSACLKRQ